MSGQQSIGFSTSTGLISHKQSSSSFCKRINVVRQDSNKPVAPPKKRVRMLFVDPVHTMPEFMNQIIVSCGVGIVGIVGTKATEQARALQQADYRNEKMDALNMNIDSFQRRRELANVKFNRDWEDVKIDKYSNVLVQAEQVPELESEDDLEAFDKLLMDSPAAKRISREKQSGGNTNNTNFIPKATDYIMDENEDQF